jgi:hypothetical protein
MVYAATADGAAALDHRLCRRRPDHPPAGCRRQRGHQVSRATGAGRGRVRGGSRRRGVGPECGVLLPATAFTDVRLLRPTRLTAANAEIRQLAGTMADQDTLATADRFCAYMHDPISYAHGVTSVATTAAETLAGGRRVCQVAAHVMRSPGALPHFVTEIDGAGHPLHPRPLATRERAAGHHSPTGGPARSSNR